LAASIVAGVVVENNLRKINDMESGERLVVR
jgi:hypothetical protein